MQSIRSRNIAAQQQRQATTTQNKKKNDIEKEQRQQEQEKSECRIEAVTQGERYCCLSFCVTPSSVPLSYQFLINYICLNFTFIASEHVINYHLNVHSSGQMCTHYTCMGMHSTQHGAARAAAAAPAAAAEPQSKHLPHSPKHTHIHRTLTRSLRVDFIILKSVCALSACVLCRLTCSMHISQLAYMHVTHTHKRWITSSDRSSIMEWNPAPQTQI